MGLEGGGWLDVMIEEGEEKETALLLDSIVRWDVGVACRRSFNRTTADDISSWRAREGRECSGREIRWG